jgi:hypothetical protein
MIEKDLARRRDFHPARPADDQLDTQACFQIPDLAAQ